MAERNQNSNEPGYNRFDEMMFGPRRRASQDGKEAVAAPDQAEETESFDLFGTAQTVMETYQQLSPYVREISGLIKQFRK
ncbi:hypothetical protein ERJ70_04825 [Sediminibacillus dalangtanensis]|uniref:YppG-like protein n=1 Tax=Sediminibacillus dalangtanensis TaxID=2729421 RepID=A0ABX7VSA4_9BACI|nr:hypothetical protein [Sediminibacillus dalangtanensis]QTM98680.1 hypothetical protein ERJ70_04825 [Sediminibacillus dalangtanensis]